LTDYAIDLDPAHRVIRLTMTAVVTEELAEECYRSLSFIASRGGPYAAIFDLSGVTSTTLSPDAVRGLARRAPAIPAGRPRVIVAEEPWVFGMARMFQICRDFLGEQFHVVRSLEEAYDMIGVRSENFTERIFPKDRAA
jgi:hypothetical protein